MGGCLALQERGVGYGAPLFHFDQSMREDSLKLGQHSSPLERQPSPTDEQRPSDSIRVLISDVEEKI
jgi:hypothetical protein